MGRDVAARVHVGPGLDADDDVRLGYLSGRDHRLELVVGRRARMRSGTVVYAGSTIGDDLTTGHHVVIREESRIGNRVSVWSNSVIDYCCEIGDDVKIHTNCYVAQFSVIGSGAFLAPGTSFANDLYPGDAASARLMRGPEIGPGAQLGVNVTVLPYVRVGEGAVIGAGSVVTRDVPAGIVAYGCPAVPVKGVEELDEITRRRSATPGALG